LSLDQLIIKCKKGNAKAQGDLYNLYSRKLFSLCLKYSRNYAEAEDSLQDAFLTIFKKVAQFNNKGSFEGWMKRIVINTALQKYRKQGYLDVVNENQIEEITVDVDELDVSVDFLLKIIQELPDRYRLVFNLYALDGYSHKEIAKTLAISQGTSKSNLSRARMILKERIEALKTEQKLQHSL
jgi:RNA polymerase sigma-70 factor (ECF subfamily)